MFRQTRVLAKPKLKILILHNDAEGLLKQRYIPLDWLNMISDNLPHTTRPFDKRPAVESGILHQVVIKGIPL